MCGPEIISEKMCLLILHACLFLFHTHCPSCLILSLIQCHCVTRPFFYFAECFYCSFYSCEIFGVELAELPFLLLAGRACRVCLSRWEGGLLYPGWWWLAQTVAKRHFQLNAQSDPATGLLYCAFARRSLGGFATLAGSRALQLSRCVRKSPTLLVLLDPWPLRNLAV